MATNSIGNNVNTDSESAHSGASRPGFFSGGSMRGLGNRLLLKGGSVRGRK